MNKFKINLFIFLIIIVPSLCWAITAPVTNYTSIGSDYGPRHRYGLPDFHHGIDYAVSANTLIKGIVTSTISGFTIQSNDNYVATNSGWRYLHLPDNGSNGGKNYKIRLSANITNLKYILISEGTNHIVLTTRNLTSEEIELIRGENDNILSTDIITYTTQITENNPFYVSGTNFPHADKGIGCANPLRELPRNESGAPSVSITDPADNSFVKDIVTVTANVLTTSDYDLNKIEFYYRPAGGSWTLIDYIEFDPKHNIGDPPSPSGIDEFYSNGNVGSFPVDNGNDNFKCKWNTTNLSDGTYEFRVKAIDIAGNYSESQHGFMLA